MSSDNHSLAKFGGIGSILLGISYLVIGVAAVTNPALQAEGAGKTRGEVFAIFLDHMIWTRIENLSFGLGSLCGLIAIVAISQRVQSRNEGWVRWATMLAGLCFTIIAIENFRAFQLLPSIARTYLDADPVLQASLNPLIVVFLDIDPLGYTYAGIGLWLATVNVLALWSGAWSKVLAYLGIAGGVIYVLMMISDVLEIQTMFLITVLLGSVVMAPVWYIWMGVALLRGEQLAPHPVPASVQEAAQGS